MCIGFVQYLLRMLLSSNSVNYSFQAAMPQLETSWRASLGAIMGVALTTFAVRRGARI